MAHFVFGLREQREPFHFLHYAAVESCRRMLRPETIYFHHGHLPWGPWWDRVRPHVRLVEVEHLDEVAPSRRRIPAEYLYAHQADFVRLDVLVEHGGVYADIDTIFLRPFPDELFEAPFVIGREAPVRDERTHRLRPSLCNAVLMSEPGAAFARRWRAEMPGALDGTWSNHSGFLAERLSGLMPDEVRVEPEASFFPFPPTPAGLSRLLEQRVEVPAGALSVHLWAHLWWARERRDFTPAHAGWCTPESLRATRTTVGDLARPYLPAPPAARTGRRRRPGGWSYLSFDEDSGYGVAARRCLAALQGAGVEPEWVPFTPGGGWGLGYEPALGEIELHADGDSRPVLVAHLLPEYLPPLRARFPDAFLVGHTVWDTDRIPGHWAGCLEEADLVVVPSRFSADAVARSRVGTPVEVVPHAVAPAGVEGPEGWPRIPDDVFVFYTIGEWTERKALEKTVEAYARAFTAEDPVVLVVKTSPGVGGVFGRSPRRAGEGTSAWALARTLRSHPDHPAIELITRPLGHAEIGAMHRRGDCYVSLCRGEGFGLGAFDAAARGKPVVMTGFGGQLEFLRASPYLVDFDLVPVHDPAGFPSYAPDQRWAEPDVDHGAALLREVTRDPQAAAAAFEPIAADIRRRFAPEAVAEAFRAAVEHHLPDPRRGRPTPVDRRP